jgi:crotonobetainyl-CoA:carnitine CoA-transferase CaiB-like acyl-CoA transferase
MPRSDAQTSGAQTSGTQASGAQVASGIGAARPGPLAGIRVLDIATMIAAPLTAAILGDYGAEVIKVELPGRGDTVRRMGTQRDGVGLYWRTLGRNKQSVALDLRVPEAQELLLRWLPRFDVLIENFRPGTLDRYNLGTQRLHAANPRLVILRMTAFGQTGPYRLRQGFGTLAETMSGAASVLVKGVRGFSAERPALTSFPLGDVTAGLAGANGVLAALLHAQRTGIGEVIDLAIYEALLKFMELEILSHEDAAGAPPQDARRQPDAAPRGVFRCGDGNWIALSGSTQPVAERILALIGGDALAHDPRFLTNALRVAHVDALDDRIDAWCAARGSAEAIRLISAAGGGVGPVETVRSLLVNPQVREREAIVEVPDGTSGPLRMTNVIPRFAGHRRALPTPGPLQVGEHTRQILARDLGLDERELARLRVLGAIGGEPDDATTKGPSHA